MSTSLTLTTNHPAASSNPPDLRLLLCQLIDLMQYLDASETPEFQRQLDRHLRWGRCWNLD